MEHKFVKLIDLCHFQEEGDHVKFSLYEAGILPPEIFQQMGKMRVHIDI